MFDFLFSEYLENASLVWPFDIRPVIIYIVWYYFLFSFYAIIVSFVCLLCALCYVLNLVYRLRLDHFCALCAEIVNLRKSQLQPHFVNPYLWVTLCNPQTGATLQVRALLDTVSTSSFISESVAKRLKLVQSRVAHESRFEWSVFVGLQPRPYVHHANVRLYVKSGTSQLLNWQPPKYQFERYVAGACVASPVNMIIGQDLYMTFFGSQLLHPIADNAKQTLPVIITEGTDHIANIQSLFGLVIFGCVDDDEEPSIFQNFLFNLIVLFFSWISTFSVPFEKNPRIQRRSIYRLGAILIVCHFFEAIVKSIIVGKVFLIVFKWTLKWLFQTLPRKLKMFCTESNLTVLRKYQVVPQPTTSDYDPTPKQMVIINEFIREPIQPKLIRIIFVPILPVHVHCGDEVHLLNVLLDTSSPYSYIDDKVAHKLQLERTVTTPHLISKKYCSFDYAFETVSVRISNCANPLIDDTVKLHVDYHFKPVTVPDHIAEFMKSLFISEGLEASADFDPARNDIVIGLDLLPLFMKIDPLTASPHNLYQMDLTLDEDTNALFVNSRYGWALFGAEDVWFDVFIKEKVSNIRKFLNSLDVDRDNDYRRYRGRNVVIRRPRR